jgi:Zn-dependent protease
MTLHVWVCIFVAIIVHEAGHFIMAQLRGVRVKRVGISWMGPYLVRERGSRTDTVLIAAAGPATNLLVFVWSLMTGDGISAAVQLLLAVTNLLPIAGSDGYRIVRELSLHVST